MDKQADLGHNTALIPVCNYFCGPWRTQGDLGGIRATVA